MSDLISRSELLTSFNNKNIQITFDLPVEEVLGEDVDLDDFAMLVQDAIQAYKKMIIDTIKNQPTAYDIDNVANAVEEITERILNNCDEIELDWSEEERTGYDMNEDILKIRHLVKHGCIETDDVCEWKLSDTKKLMPYKTSCGNEDLHDNSYKYCPYCGKKILCKE